MDTPITVSSTTSTNKSDFLQLNYSPCKHDDSIISLSSTSYERVPVSWEKKNLAYTRTDSNTTLTNIQKVSDWIQNIEGNIGGTDSTEIDLNNDIMDDDINFCNSIKEAPRNVEPVSKSVILFRCDFDKSVDAKTYYPTLNPFNTTTSLINYYKNENVERMPNTNSKITKNRFSATPVHNSRNYTDNLHNCFLESSSDKVTTEVSNFSINRDGCTFKNEEKSDGSSDLYEVPLSPESRKKELCSYLQLMNPADKKEIFILQNRRSTRVRNLAAMQEKKEMERKIKNKEVEVMDQTENIVEKCATLKSFKELNINIDKSKSKREYLDENKDDSDIETEQFYFPFPAKSLTEITNDFDDTMSKLIPRYRRICRLKNFKLHNKLFKPKLRSKDKLINIIKNKNKEIKMNLPKCSKINKLKNICKNSLQFKEKLRKRVKKHERSNSLRSTGKLKHITLKKLIGIKEKELRKIELRKRHLTESENQEQTGKVCSRSSSKSKSVNSQCEIVTMTDQDHVDLKNFVDDVIDFNNFSEEHKRCLIESRILSNKVLPNILITNPSEEEMSKSLCSLQALSPLYGFNNSDVNELEKICEVYKNSSLIKNCSEQLIQEKFFDPEIKEKPEFVNVKKDVAVVQPLMNSVEELESPIFIKSNKDDTCQNEETNVNSLDEVIDEIEEVVTKKTSNNDHLTNGASLQEHNYAGLPSDEEEDEDEEDHDIDVDVVTVPNNNLSVTKINKYMEINIRCIEKKNKFELQPFNKSVATKSLHRSLQFLKRKNNNFMSDPSLLQQWDTDSSPKLKTRKQSHYITISMENGAVLKAFYIDFNLIVCQEYVVSFWIQTPLGNILGSQNMWIPRGQTQRLVLNGKCIQKESIEMVIAMDTSVAYIELWTKEHKSDIREGPVTDVFATVYFWKQRSNGLDKKVLQLENINGFADDVQYSVMRCSQRIIASWHSASEDSTAKKTFIHAYEMAPDYQTISNIYEFEPVEHYVSSLHNIEDCDNLIMGCGENKITLWNIEYGYIVATIELSDIKSPLSTLWVRCDRGFLFALQQCVDRELRLIAINGINHSWKKLASYNPPEGFDRLRGVCLENGLVLSFYDQGILCWKAETGEPIEETIIESDIIPSGKYIILLDDNQILVRHAMTHLMSLSVDES